MSISSDYPTSFLLFWLYFGKLILVDWSSSSPFLASSGLIFIVDRLYDSVIFQRVWILLITYKCKICGWFGKQIWQSDPHFKHFKTNQVAYLLYNFHNFFASLAFAYLSQEEGERLYRVYTHPIRAACYEQQCQHNHQWTTTVFQKKRKRVRSSHLATLVHLRTKPNWTIEPQYNHYWKFRHAMQYSQC